MRLCLPLILAACATTPSALVPPPTPGLVLSGPDTLFLGTSHEVNLSGATPGSTYRLFASATREGPQACVGGVCTDLAAPAGALATVVADASGTASFTVPVPATPERTTVLFQVAETSGAAMSNRLLVPVAPELSCIALPPSVPAGTCMVTDLPYADERGMRALDVVLADSVDPTPMVVFIHGGGFTGGDKAAVYGDPTTIFAYLNAGVSFATINYRLLEEVDTEGVRKPLGDATRALQYLRHHAETFNIDPDRIVLTGGSAGGGTSLWLATHDDMADPTAEDPFERQSTRVLGAAVTGTQSTYDLVRWETDVLPSVGFSLVDYLRADADAPARLRSFYGTSQTAGFGQLFSPELTAYRAEVDILGHMSGDDPPIRVQNNQRDTGLPTTSGTLYHHALHAVALGDRAMEVGMSADIHAPALNITGNTDSVDFVLGLLVP